MTPNFILVRTHHHFHLRLLPLNLAPWEFMTGSWTIDSSSSPITTILTGVPQGSVLGPLLFVLFISPIANVINPGQACNNLVSFHQYADDTQLYIGANSSSLPSQIASIESCTLRVHDWLFTSIHLSLRPSHSSTQGLSPFRPLLNQLSPSLSRVHLSNFRHQSRIWVWVSILTPDYLLINRYLKHVKRHISTSAPCATFDHLSPLRQLRQWRRL